MRSRLTSCFIRHFPSSVSSSVGCAGAAVCTESIIMSSSRREHFKQNGDALVIKKKLKICSSISFFFYPLFPPYLLLVQALFWKCSSQLEEKEQEVLQPHKNSPVCHSHSQVSWLFKLNCMKTINYLTLIKVNTSS